MASLEGVRSPMVLVIFLFKQNKLCFLSPLLRAEFFHSFSHRYWFPQKKKTYTCAKRQTKWGSLLPSRNAVSWRRSTPPGTVCVVLCPPNRQQAPCVRHALPTFQRGRDVCGWARVLRRQPGEQELCRSCGWYCSGGIHASCPGAAPLTPGASSQYPEAQCTGRDYSDWGRVGARCRKERRGKPSDSDVRRTVFSSGVLSRRVQMGKPKELFHRTHFPFSFLYISLFTSRLAGTTRRKITTIFLLTWAIYTALYIGLSLSQHNANNKYPATLWASALLSIKEGVTCRSKESSAYLRTWSC